MSQQPKFYIIDQDTPCVENITELRDDGKLHYVHPAGRNWWTAPFNHTATPLEDFGINVVIRVAADGKVVLSGEGKSRVKSPDGRRRSWQGASHFCFLYEGIHPPTLDCWDSDIQQAMDDQRGSVKYIAITEHSRTIEDLKKARLYIDREIRRLEEGKRHLSKVLANRQP